MNNCLNKVIAFNKANVISSNVVVHLHLCDSYILSSVSI